MGAVEPAHRPYELQCAPLSLALVHTLVAGWKVALSRSFAGDSLYLDLHNSGYPFHIKSSAKTERTGCMPILQTQASITGNVWGHGTIHSFSGKKSTGRYTSLKVWTMILWGRVLCQYIYIYVYIYMCVCVCVCVCVYKTPSLLTLGTLPIGM